jgi:pyruvate dehydrogenase E1 component alpha subunit
VAETKIKPKKSAKKVDVLEQHGISAELARDLMRDMLLYRRFEEKAEEAYAIGKIGGFCHLHIGQEGAAAGAIKPLREDDYVVTAYREHTQAIAKGVSPNAVMAELYGRVDGSSGGKGGSMHIFDAGKRFMGGHGIVGGQIPLATGMAWKVRYRGEDAIVVCFLGDAAVNQGAFHESLNLAAIWQLPIIYVVENNSYGMGTAFSRVSETEMAVKPSSHGIVGCSVNGRDVLETFAFFRDLAEDVRGGAGPQFVDLQTYRFRGHSMSDPVSGTYRYLDEAELEEMDAEARRIAGDAAEFADASPAPGPEALYANVWADSNTAGRLFFDGREQR